MNENTSSKIYDQPKTKAAWRTMGWGIGAVLITPVLGIMDSVIRPILDPESVNPNAGFRGGGFGSMVLSLVLSVLALITGFRAVRDGERSWVVWVGIIAALLVGSFWVFMIVGELLFPH